MRKFGSNNRIIFFYTCARAINVETTKSEHYKVLSCEVVLTSHVQAIVKASPKASSTGGHITETASWNEVGTLLRINLVAGFQAKHPSQNQLYVPETVHVATIVAALGSTYIRKTVYGLVMNLLQSLFLARAEEAPSIGMRRLLDDFGKEEVLQLFGLTRSTLTSDYAPFDTHNDRQAIENQEKLTLMLCNLLEVSSGSQGEFCTP